jgi:hypothetical protein
MLKVDVEHDAITGPSKMSKPRFRKTVLSTPVDASARIRNLDS